MTGVDYKNRRDYVAILNYALRAFPDHEGIAYVNTEEGKEYVKIWDQIGGAVYLEVTGLKLYEIFDSVALCMRSQEPPTMVNDIQIMRSLVHLFRQEVARQQKKSQ